MKRFLTIVAVIAVAVVAFVFWRQNQVEKQQAETLASLQTETAQMGALTAFVGATGIVRSNQNAALVWNTSGTVELVNVSVGDEVTTDQVLCLLKQTSLSQNIILAEADLLNAQKALDDLYNSELQQAQLLQAIEDAQIALDNLLNPELQQALALQAIADAEKVVETTERSLSSLHSTADQADIDAAKAQVILAGDALSQAQEQFEPYENKPEDNLVRANLQARLSAAQQSYDAAVRNLNALQGTGSALDISVAEANLASAQAQLTQAERDYEQIKDGPTPAEITLAEARVADAEYEWERIQDGPPAEDVAAAEARIAAAEATLNMDQITAPFNGVLTEVIVKPGDQVNPGSIAFRLDDLSRLLVDVEVSEVDINRIKIGQEAVLTFDAVLAKEYHGTVTEVALVGTTSQGVVSFKVTVELEDADEDVRSGMTAGVNIVVSQLENVLLVPNRAVRLQNGDRVVYVLRSDNPLPQAVQIELGSSSDLYSQILDGELKEGDEIVLNPPSEASIFGGGPPGGR